MAEVFYAIFNTIVSNISKCSKADSYFNNLFGIIWEYLEIENDEIELSLNRLYKMYDVLIQ